jgi:capsular exopolysaccharide synthesis family protein
MERIKKALERARQEREAILLNGGERRAVGPLEVGSEGEISYSATRVFKPTAAVLSRHRIITEDRDDEVVAAYKVLRTQVLKRMTGNGWNALAITSPGHGEGKTLTAINLAISLAREVNHTVLLADLDLRAPRIHEYLGYEARSGASDYLMRKVALPEILFNPSIERLVIIPGGSAVRDSSELLSSPRMVSLVEELKTRYPSRIILFDLPPLLSADDALVFSSYVDAVLLVVAEGATDREQLARAIDFLRGTELLGTVLNKSDEKLAPYHPRAGATT